MRCEVGQNATEVFAVRIWIAVVLGRVVGEEVVGVCRLRVLDDKLSLASGHSIDILRLNPDTQPNMRFKVDVPGRLFRKQVFVGMRVVLFSHFIADEDVVVEHG